MLHPSPRLPGGLMARYDRGYDSRAGYRGDPYGRYQPSAARGSRLGRGRAYGSDYGPQYGGGYERGSGRWLGDFRPHYQERFDNMPHPRAPERAYGRDYWWLGEHELKRQGRFDRQEPEFVEFDRHSHPR